MTHVAMDKTNLQAAPLARMSLPLAHEQHFRDWLVYPLLVIFVALLAMALATFYLPAHQGPDQNSYDVAARMLVEHHQLYFTLHNPWQFVGVNEVELPDGRIYPKYPPGVSMLAAMAWIIGGGPTAMYLLDPICVVLACWISFFLFRTMVGDFLALMGVIWLACNPLVLFFANYGDSHGAALLFTVLGFWLLLTWWTQGGIWRAVLGGTTLGFCCWIRYTEILWFLPLVAVVMCQFWNQRQPLWLCLLALAAFCVPVAILAVFNWTAFGEPWRTAYSFCHEQTGFGWKYFIGNPSTRPPRPGNWRIFLDQISHLGLFLLFPLAILGGIRLFWSNWKLALVLVLWIVPTSAVYLLYYWAPDNIAYARFFIDVLPALIMVALWLLGRAMRLHRAATAVVVGTLTLLGSGYNLYQIAPRLVAATASKTNLVEASGALQTCLPRGSVIFANEFMDNYLASIGGYRLYNVGMFSDRFFQKMRRVVRHRGPQIFESLKARQYLKLVGKPGPNGTWNPRSHAELLHDELRLIHQAWHEHKAVAFLGLQQSVPLSHLTTKVLACWNPPPWHNQWVVREILPTRVKALPKVARP